MPLPLISDHITLRRRQRRLPLAGLRREDPCTPHLVGSPPPAGSPLREVWKKIWGCALVCGEVDRGSVESNPGHLDQKNRIALYRLRWEASPNLTASTAIVAPDYIPWDRGWHDLFFPSSE